MFIVVLVGVLGLSLILGNTLGLVSWANSKIVFEFVPTLYNPFLLFLTNIIINLLILST